MPACRLTVPDNDDPAPFTPAAYPGLSPEACAILNMPVEQCPPEVLCILLTALAEDLAEQLPPEMGLADPQTVFATLWGRFAGALGEAAPDTALNEQPDAAPVIPKDAASGEPPASPIQIAPDALPASPIQMKETAPADTAAVPAIAASATTAEAAVLIRPAFRRSLSDGRAAFRRRRPLLGRGRPRRHRRPLGSPQRPPLRRLCYAACAGPP